MLEQVQRLVEETGATVHSPFVRLLLAEHARLSGNTHGQEGELREALRLFTEMGATLHAKRTQGWLDSISERTS